MSETTPQSTPKGFEADFERAVQRVRGALTELYAAADADARSPQDVARRFGINRNLSWKVGKIIHSTDAFRAYSHFPASGSLELLLKAFAKAGARDVARDEVRAAWAEFEAMAARHAGDRRTLKLLVDNVAGDPEEGPYSSTSRENAFQGNSAILGVQARARTLVQIVAPNKDKPELIDNAMVGGVFDYRRLRPSVRWPIGQRIIHHDSHSERGWVEPIDERGGDETLPLMRDFCSQPIPELHHVREDSLTITELAEGPVGKLGSLTCVFGWIHRAYAPAVATADDSQHEHVLRLDTPAEFAMLDLLIHEDLAVEPGFCLYSTMHGRMQLPLFEHERYHLPKPDTITDLGSGPPVVATPHVPRYPEMVRMATERLGHELTAFRGYRFSMTFPPIPTIADFYYELPRR